MMRLIYKVCSETRVTYMVRGHLTTHPYQEVQVTWPKNSQAVVFLCLVKGYSHMHYTKFPVGDVQSHTYTRSPHTYTRSPHTYTRSPHTYTRSPPPPPPHTHIYRSPPPTHIPGPAHTIYQVPPTHNIPGPPPPPPPNQWEIWSHLHSYTMHKYCWLHDHLTRKSVTTSQKITLTYTPTLITGHTHHLINLSCPSLNLPCPTH